MALIKVGLLGLLDDYDRSTGQGIQRYMHEVYKRMKTHAKGISLDKAGYTKAVRPFGGGISFLFGNMFQDFDAYDIIHNMDQKPLLPLKKGKALLINTVHDFQSILAPEYNDSGLKERLWQPIINYGMRRSLKADHLIARSTLTREHAIRLGYDKRNITVVSDGVDERYLRKPHRVMHKGFVIGYLGAFRRRKNVQFAIDAMKKVDQEDISMQIWGKPEFMYNELMDMIIGHKNIGFMGFAPEDKIVEIYDSFDAFVFPSVFEGFGIPIIEAQARGLPVIIYKGGRIPKEVRKYCFEAEDESHMAQIIEDLKEKGYDERLRTKAIEYARGFTWEKEALETLAVYKKVFEHG